MFKRVKIAVPILVLCLGHYAAHLVLPAEEAWSLQPRCHTSNLLHLVLVLPRATSRILLLMLRAAFLRTQKTLRRASAIGTAMISPMKTHNMVSRWSKRSLWPGPRRHLQQHTFCELDKDKRLCGTTNMRQDVAIVLRQRFQQFDHWQSRSIHHE